MRVAWARQGEARGCGGALKALPLPLGEVPRKRRRGPSQSPSVTAPPVGEPRGAAEVWAVGDAGPYGCGGGLERVALVFLARVHYNGTILQRLCNFLAA